MASASSSLAPATPAWRVAAWYALMTAAAIGAFVGIQQLGEGLYPRDAGTINQADAPSLVTQPPAHSADAPSPGNPLPRVLLALAAVVLVGRGLAVLLEKVGQPPVIGEILAGIFLGPSLVGAICRDWFGAADSPILPAEAAPYLGIIAQLGVILYMFLIGLEFNPSHLRGQAKAAAAIAHASMLLPFVLGAALALLLFRRYAPPGVPFTSFALFLGAALAVTAFPVLARILSDRGVAQTKLGVLALTCAAANDVTAWCVLAFIAGVVRAEAGGALRTVALSAAYVAAMLLLVRPLAARYLGRPSVGGLGSTKIALVFGGLLLSALATEWIGIHAVFGAFLLGVVIPHDSHVAQSLRGGLEQLVLVLLLPAFFAFTGMRTELGLVSSASGWMWCGVIILAASVGKFGGTWLAARVTGLDSRTSTALGILMNTRGLMELIVLNIGLDLGVVTPELFALMVVMALVTTVATTPLFVLVARTGKVQGLEASPRL